MDQFSLKLYPYNVISTSKRPYICLVAYENVKSEKAYEKWNKIYVTYTGENKVNSRDNYLYK